LAVSVYQLGQPSGQFFRYVNSFTKASLRQLLISAQHFSSLLIADIHASWFVFI